MGCSTLAQEVNVGDKMFEYKVGTDKTDFFFSVDPEDISRVTQFYPYIDSETGDLVYLALHNICYGKTSGRPFAVYVIRNNVLYLDNNPTDGFIDEVVNSPKKPLELYAPECKIGI